VRAGGRVAHHRGTRVSVGGAPGNFGHIRGPDDLGAGNDVRSGSLELVAEEV
jgi:hypothetical protein